MKNLQNETVTPESVKIFGIGLIKTGTTSLSSAMETLGFKHTHAKRSYLLKCVCKGNLEELFRWVDYHDSFEDWPYPFIYRELDNRYINSRFILTTRVNEQVWLESIIRHAEWCGKSEGRRQFFGYAMPQEHEAEYIASYLQHNQQVRNYFRNRPEKFLEVCWERGDGWAKLCSFLNLPIPDVPFPVVNTSTERIKK